MNIGIDKPCVINGLLELKKGAFFIDVDYTKDLKVEFDVIVNESSSDLYVDPLYIKKFVIEWDSVKCQKYFYFINSQGIKIDQSVNGFLSGITGVQLLENGNAVGCDETSVRPEIKGISRMKLTSDQQRERRELIMTLTAYRIDSF